MITAFAIGVAFGFALERAGLGSARKLIGQFYLTDFTVFKVMFSAIVTAMLGAFWLSRLGVIDLSSVYVPRTWLLPQLAGGLIFGVGFVVAGLCPGTSCVAAATGRGDGLAVIAGMFAGVLIAPVRGFYESTPRGAWTLPELLHVPYGVVVFAVVLIALAGFAVAERIEKRA
ncbi:MAG TPA: YeeE/YedE thiosulfate transporter family protein [Thermoanaerobaculia bacterium]|nr:YeeE/YedE thiosulfate transporter family protein [Thermoanaerobaculia bacterium]